MKNLHIVIIGGVSGAIGDAFFQEFVLEKDIIIFGLSRRGLRNVEALPDHSCAVNINYSDKKNVDQFCEKVISLGPKEITYIHCMGPFKTELDPETRKRRIHRDIDKDGVDDEIYERVFVFPKAMADSMINKRGSLNIQLNFVNIGSLVEKYNISIFGSWIKVRDKVKREFKRISEKFENVCSIDVLVSTILSSKELIDRPYVFGTDNNPQFWLKPQELTSKVRAILSKRLHGFFQYEIFHKAPGVSKERFEEGQMIKRRLIEHFNVRDDLSF
ncbi:MAG: hypothetical protein Q8P81_01370 [Nanoarchaeota archaeon]|nr:hypothetical protein [Nanoarchaeota archaeon]